MSGIKELHEEMTFHVLRAGVGPAAWAKLINNIHRKSEARQEFILSLLRALRAKEWKAVHDTWTLPNATPEMWENMITLYDEHSFPELKRLCRTQRALRDRWLKLKVELKTFIVAERDKRGT